MNNRSQELFDSIIGQRFAELEVVGCAGKDKRGRLLVTVRCDCGTETVKGGWCVKAGKVLSCGCLQKRRITEVNGRHGLSRTPIHNVWWAMLTRCSNPKQKSYKNYGGRGITVCERWSGNDGFQNFLADMGARPSERHTIDRINNNGNYEPSNCRWATPKEQGRNKRSTRYATIGGVTRPFIEWADIHKVQYKSAHRFLMHGASPEEALQRALPR